MATTAALRPNTLTKAAEILPRYQWDYEHAVPANAFWSTFDRATSQAVFDCYDDGEPAPSYENLPIDSPMSHEEKCKRLRTDLAWKLQHAEAVAAPQGLWEVDARRNRNLLYAIATLDTALGDKDAEERAALSLLSTGDPNARNRLADIYMRQQRWAEAKPYLLQALTWIRGLEKLGPNSPQALGTMRGLVRCCWKMGEREEAESWVGDCLGAIEGMVGGGFEKYCGEEAEELERVIQKLERGE